MVAPDSHCFSAPVEYDSISLCHNIMPDQLHTAFLIQNQCSGIAHLRFRQTWRTLTTNFLQYLKISSLTSPLLFWYVPYKVQSCFHSEHRNF